VVAESTVRAFVAEVRIELTNAVAAVTVPQLHDPGEEAEVDFGEFKAWVDGTLVKLWMFCLRLSASGRGFHVAFANQAQEAFLEGHRLAFEHLGGVPARIRYDNLKPAVVKVLMGRDRVEHERFVALRSHYGYDSFYCMPGIDGAHEKGGVEGEVGRFRRRHLVPVPRVADLAELNELIAAGDRTDDDRRIGHRSETVGEAFAVEAPFLAALPGDAFECFTELSAKVDTKARVCQGVRPLILGSGPEQELAESIEARCPEALSLVDRTNFQEIITLARHAKLAIGNDTGPMHLIAAADGCPCLVLFSAASDPARCAPRGENVIILQRDPLASLSVGEVTSLADLH
jgi:hypothetical protein